MSSVLNVVQNRFRDPLTTETLSIANDFTEIKKIQASDAQAYDYFGYSVAVSDTRIVVGAYFEDTTANNAGSAYIFTSGFSPFGDLCAYYDLGDPTVLDTNFSWSDTT